MIDCRARCCCLTPLKRCTQRFDTHLYGCGSLLVDNIMLYRTVSRTWRVLVAASKDPHFFSKSVYGKTRGLRGLFTPGPQSAIPTTSCGSDLRPQWSSPSLCDWWQCYRALEACPARNESGPSGVAARTHPLSYQPVESLLPPLLRPSTKRNNSDEGADGSGTGWKLFAAT